MKKFLRNQFIGSVAEVFSYGFTVPEDITYTSPGNIDLSEIERIPEGRFFYCDNDNFIAIDNTTGEAFTESFVTRRQCICWLKYQYLETEDVQGLGILGLAKLISH